MGWIVSISRRRYVEGVTLNLRIADCAIAGKDVLLCAFIIGAALNILSSVITVRINFLKSCVSEQF